MYLLSFISLIRLLSAMSLKLRRLNANIFICPTETLYGDYLNDFEMDFAPARKSPGYLPITIIRVPMA